MNWELELGLEVMVGGVIGMVGWDGILVEVEAAGGDVDRLPVLKISFASLGFLIGGSYQ